MTIKYDNVSSKVSKTRILSLLNFNLFIVPAVACIHTRHFDLSDPKE